MLVSMQFRTANSMLLGGERRISIKGTPSLSRIQSIDNSCCINRYLIEILNILASELPSIKYHEDECLTQTNGALVLMYNEIKFIICVYDCLVSQVFRKVFFK